MSGSQSQRESDPDWNLEEESEEDFEVLVVGDTDSDVSDSDWEQYDDAAVMDDTDDSDIIILEDAPDTQEGGDMEESESQHSASDDENTEEGPAAEEDGGAPPAKMAKMDPNPGARYDDNESDSGMKCIICFEEFTNSGEHRISCLKCGHVFGKNCLEKAVRRYKRCPECNSKAKCSDIRVIYVNALKAIDTTELTEAKNVIERQQIMLSNCTLENSKLKINVEQLNMKVQRLEKSQHVCSNCVSTTHNNSASTGPAVAGTSRSMFLETAQTIPPVAATGGRKTLRYNFRKYIEVRDGPCRVGTYNESLGMMVVSHDMKSALYPQGCCGIKQINMVEIRPTVSLPLQHQKQIRDMQFSLSQRDMLLSVSMDKKAILFNCNGNVSVQTFQTDYPLWSCVWDEVQRHIFYVGCSNGSIIAYDIRSPQDPLATYTQGQDRSPVCRLKYVGPTYQSSSFNLSGLLVQKLNSVSFGEYLGSDFRFHPLPLDGPFFNLDFEPVSRHILVSLRPSARTNVDSGSHLLCQLSQYYSDVAERTVVTSNIIRTYEGSNRDGQRISRPSVFSTEDNYVFVLANGLQNTVRYWDISQPESDLKTITNAPDYALDYIHGRINGNQFLGLVSERGVHVYNETLS